MKSVIEFLSPAIAANNRGIAKRNLDRNIDWIQPSEKAFANEIISTHETSFPTQYRMYTTIKDWRNADYLSNLEKLVRKIYAIGKKDDIFQEKWSKLKASVMDGPSLTNFSRG